MRPVGLPAELVEMLLVWKPLQAATRLKAGPAWHDLGLIFTDAIGRPLDGQRLRRFFGRALTKAQVGRRRLYALRHTMATLMLLRRESPRLVAARLGHANETLVLRTYGHVIPGQDQEAADRLAQMLRDMQCTRSAQAVKAVPDLNRYADSQGSAVSNTNLAERVGFEPTIGCPHNGFRVGGAGEAGAGSARQRGEPVPVVRAGATTDGCGSIWLQHECNWRPRAPPPQPHSGAVPRGSVMQGSRLDGPSRQVLTSPQTKRPVAALVSKSCQRFVALLGSVHLCLRGTLIEVPVAARCTTLHLIAYSAS